MDDLETTGDEVGQTESDGTTEVAAPLTTDAVEYEPTHGASVYDSIVDPLVENDAHSLVVALAGGGKRVLELGCATGSTTKVLQERGCSVVGVEIDADAAQIAEQFCERVIVADLDLLDVNKVLGDETFDVIIAADVLEHLRDPQRVLKACMAHLRPEGEVLLSIPNIAHADVRLSLLRGDFDYQWCGILDETHMRFFTRRTLEAFLDDCGLVAVAWDRTQRPLGETEIAWQAPFDDAVLDWVARQPDADTYQFVVRAAAAPPGSHLREVDTRLREVDTLCADNAQLRTQVEKLNADIVTLQADKQSLVLAAEAAESEIAELRANLRAVQDRSAAELAASRTGIATVERDLHATFEELNVVTVERDEYRSSFEALIGVQEELVAVRRSESFRLGRALLSPMVTSRRIARAWRRAKRPA